MLEKFKNDEKYKKFLKSNPWFLKDRFLFYHVCGIHKELMDEGYIEDSVEYLKQLEVRIYKMFPDKVKKYFSKNN